MIFDKELTHKIGTIVCLLYAVIWVVAWFDPPTALTTMFDTDLHPTLPGRIIPPIFAALLFAAAPVMRRDTRTSQIMVSVGIVVMISSGLWSAWQGGIPFDQVLFWLVVPLGIAAWAFFGPTKPDSEALPHIRYPIRGLNPGPAFVLGVGIVFLVVGISAGEFISNFGFGDIVVPRYAAVTFGLCCIMGALVAWKFGSDGDGRSSSNRKAARPLAKSTILVGASPQGGFRWSVVIDGQTVGTGERATELEARNAADALVRRIEARPPEAP